MPVMFKSRKAGGGGGGGGADFSKLTSKDSGSGSTYTITEDGKYFIIVTTKNTSNSTYIYKNSVDIDYIVKTSSSTGGSSSRITQASGFVDCLVGDVISFPYINLHNIYKYE